MILWAVSRPNARRHLLPLMLVCLLALVAAQAPAEATSFGVKLLRGDAWLGGNGVDVFSNGNLGCRLSSTRDCGPDSMVDGVYVGEKWQCVELAQRLYTVRGWHTGTFGVDYAREIFAQASRIGMQAYPNGSGYIPVPGDLIVVGAPTGAGAGHVSVVDRVHDSQVNIVEQNWDNTTGRGRYTLIGSSLSRAGAPNILGVVHDPDNASTMSRGRTMNVNGDGLADLLSLSGGRLSVRKANGSGGWAVPTSSSQWPTP